MKPEVDGNEWLKIADPALPFYTSNGHTTLMLLATLSHHSLLRALQLLRGS